MAIEVDPQHPWRSATLADIPVTRIVIDWESYPTHKEELEGVLETTEAWHDSVERSNVPRQLAADSYRHKVLVGQYEVRDVRREADTTGCISQRTDIPFDFFSKATACMVTSDGDHMPVLADVNAATKGVLRTACSVEEVARAAGIKLPRVVAQPSARVSPLASASAGVSDFEALRGAILRRSANSDYGLRLFQLAKVVCHATVCHEAGLLSSVSDLAKNAVCQSLLVAQTPLLSVRDLTGNSFWYVGSEASATFRAFLYMGAVGLENVAQPQTVYSMATSGNEVAEPTRVPVVYVRVGSLTGPVAPTAADFEAVLRSPELCKAYYMAYANLVGVGREAGLILQQTACLPHLTGPECRLPYKPDYPCIDAAPYLLSSAKVQKTESPLDIYNLVGSSCVRALQIKVGLGARIGGFDNNSKVDQQQVVSQTMQSLADYWSARKYIDEVVRALGDGASGLEWVSPFFPALALGVDECLTAFRSHAWLLSTFARPITHSLSGVYSTGVEMSAAVFAGPMASKRYKETVIVQLAARRAVSLLCDKFSQQTVPRNVYTSLGYMRSWTAVCQFVGFTVIGRKHESKPSSSGSSGSVVRATQPSFLRRRSMRTVKPSDSASNVDLPIASPPRGIQPLRSVLNFALSATTATGGIESSASDEESDAGGSDAEDDVEPAAPDIMGPPPRPEKSLFRDPPPRPGKPRSESISSAASSLARQGAVRSVSREAHERSRSRTSSIASDSRTSPGSTTVRTVVHDGAV